MFLRKTWESNPQRYYPLLVFKTSSSSIRPPSKFYPICQWTLLWSRQDSNLQQYHIFHLPVTWRIRTSSLNALSALPFTTAPYFSYASIYEFFLRHPNIFWLTFYLFFYAFYFLLYLNIRILFTVSKSFVKKKLESFYLIRASY